MEPAALPAARRIIFPVDDAGKCDGKHKAGCAASTAVQNKSARKVRRLSIMPYHTCTPLPKPAYNNSSPIKAQPSMLLIFGWQVLRQAASPVPAPINAETSAIHNGIQIGRASCRERV